MRRNYETPQFGTLLVTAWTPANNVDVVFATVDVDAEPELSARFDVRAVPTIVALRHGVVVFRRPGVLSPDTLQALVDRLHNVVPAPEAERTL